MQNDEIMKLRQGFIAVEQENMDLKEQNKKISKEKNYLDEEFKKKQSKFKGEYKDLEQNNFSLMKEVVSSL